MKRKRKFGPTFEQVGQMLENSNYLQAANNSVSGARNCGTMNMTSANSPPGVMIKEIGNDECLSAGSSGGGGLSPMITSNDVNQGCANIFLNTTFVDEYSLWLLGEINN